MLHIVGTGLGKGIFMAMNILGNGLFLSLSYQYPLDIIQNYKALLLGEYAVPGPPDMLYISFLIWAIAFAIIMPTAPKSKHPLPDSEDGV